MVTRVIAIPDKDGVIRISCDGDVIEIQVVPVVPGAAGGGTARPPPFDVGSNPFNTPSPFDLPGAYVVAPQAAGGEVDVEQLAKDVLRQFQDLNKPDPRAVVLSAAEANLHDLSRLGERIAKTLSNLPLAVDFGGFLKK